MYCWFSELNLAVEEAGGGWAGEKGPGEKQRGARKAGLLVLLAFFHHPAVPFELKGINQHLFFNTVRTINMLYSPEMMGGREHSQHKMG